jgi:hypothetical protein
VRLMALKRGKLNKMCELRIFQSVCTCITYRPTIDEPLQVVGCEHPWWLKCDNNRMSRDLRIGWFNSRRNGPEEIPEDGVVGIFLIVKLKPPVGCLREGEVQNALNRL